MPSFSEEQVADDQLADMYAYVMSLPAVEEPNIQRPELAADAHPGQLLLVEKRCLACHGLPGVMNTRFESGEAIPAVERVIEQLRTPFRNMPAYSPDQVSDEEAALIADFLLSQTPTEAQADPNLQALEPVPAPLEKALAGVGGEEALQNLVLFSTVSTGTRWIHDEQFSPGDPPGRVGDFSLQLSYDLAGDNLRLDYVRQGVAGERQFSEIIAGELGYIDGQDARFGPPGLKPMTSDRWASTLKQQRLLNPHLILQEILADPTIVSEADEQLLDGSVHHRLVVADEVAPLTLYVNAATGHISKLATLENDHLRRDVPLEAFYYNWQPLEEGLSFPAELYLALDGEIIHQEIRSAIGVNQTLEPALFEIPAEVSPEFDSDLAARGEASSQFNQSFAANGFIKDGAQTEINAQEIAPGIFHLIGVANNSMIIEQAESIVVVEAPLHQARSEAVIDWIGATFPGKPISHVLSTHHHTDHSAGLRSYVAEGATVVLHEAAVPFFEAIFQAESAVWPDALAADPVEAAIEAVPADGSVTIPDESQPVAAYPVENSHAEPGPGGQAIYEAIVDAGLEVSLVAGGHGTTIPFEEFEALLTGE
jgi:mono/diheme cytochrome c family protein